MANPDSVDAWEQIHAMDADGCAESSDVAAH